MKITNTNAYASKLNNLFLYCRSAITLLKMTTQIC